MAEGMLWHDIMHHTALIQRGQLFLDTAFRSNWIYRILYWSKFTVF